MTTRGLIGRVLFFRDGAVFDLYLHRFTFLEPLPDVRFQIAERAGLQGFDERLGVQMVGPEVTELIAEATLAIEMGATTEDIARTIHAHPTLPEAMMEAAEAVHNMAVHIFQKP